jgi:hypothetical protein
MTEFAYSIQAGEVHTLGVSALGTSWTGRIISVVSYRVLLSLRHNLNKAGWTAEVSTCQLDIFTECTDLVRIGYKGTKEFFSVRVEILMELKIEKKKRRMSVLLTYHQTQHIIQRMRGSVVESIQEECSDENASSLFVIMAFHCHWTQKQHISTT